MRVRMTRRILGGVAILAALQLAIWLGYRTIEGRRAASISPQFEYEALSGIVAEGNVRLELADGRELPLSFGERPVLLHFWATWCAPCRTELPTLLELAGEKNHDFIVLLVSVDEAWPPVRHFFRDDVPSEVVRDATGATSAFGVGTLPETILVGANGRLVARVRGARKWTSTAARNALAELLMPDR